MPTMRELLEQRQAKQDTAEESFEAKHARAMQKIGNAMAGRISAVRVVGPPLPQLSEVHRRFLRRNFGNDMVGGQCRFCNPDPVPLRCVACGYETLDRWKMKVHNIANPKWCQDWRDKKIRNWARQA